MGVELQLGLVGCGQLAERGYLAAIRLARGVTLAAVADPISVRCQQLAPGVPAWKSASELVTAGIVDALVLATPASAHLGDARLAAKAGLPTLVEKPPAADLAEAQELAGLDPRPWIGFNRRFEPALRRLRGKLPPAGSLDLDLQFYRPSNAWRSYVVRDDALLTFGPHLIDLVRWLTGSELVRVRAETVEFDRAEVEFALERGRARISCGTASRLRSRVEVRIAGGPIVARCISDMRYRRVLQRLSRPRAANALVASLAAELEEFARAVRGDDVEFLATAADGVAVMRAIEYARRSAVADGRWMTLDSTADASQGVV